MEYNYKKRYTILLIVFIYKYHFSLLKYDIFHNNHIYEYILFYIHCFFLSIFYIIKIFRIPNLMNLKIMSAGFSLACKLCWLLDI